MKKEFLITLSVLFIWTCGGGGGGGNTPTEPTGPTEPSAPVVEDILLTTNEDVPSVINLEGADPANLPLTFTIASQPTNGTFSLSGNAGTYTPNNNFNGSDTFTYFASNGSKSSNQGSVQITINPVNDDPESIDVSVSTNEDNSIDITLQANEYDGDTIVFQIDEQVSNGTLSLSGNIATYVPSSNWYGVDTFKFSVYDSSGRSIIRSGNGTIVVNALNDPPNVNDIYDVEATIGEVKPIKLNASDVDSYSVSFEIVDFPSNGTVTVSNDTAYFSPLSVGADLFTFQAYDGTDYSSPGSVFLDISEGYNNLQFNLFKNVIGKEINHFPNGFSAVGTILNNGNYLMASAGLNIDKSSDSGVNYVHSYIAPIVVEIDPISKEIISRNFIEGLSVNPSIILDILELDSGEIILVSATEDFSDQTRGNLFFHRISSTYDLVNDDFTSISLDYSTTQYSGNYSVLRRNLLELSNGNFLFSDFVLDSNFDIVNNIDSEDVLVHNDNLYSNNFDDDGNNNIIVRDLNGSLVNTIQYDSNSQNNGTDNGIFKTSYGFILFQDSKIIRFDENFKMISYFYNVYPISNPRKIIQTEDGFIIIGNDNSNDSRYKFYKLDENGNSLFSTRMNIQNTSGYTNSIVKDSNDNLIFFNVQDSYYNYGIPNSDKVERRLEGSNKGIINKITSQGNLTF